MLEHWERGNWIRKKQMRTLCATVGAQGFVVVVLGLKLYFNYLKGRIAEPKVNGEVFHPLVLSP